MEESTNPDPICPCGSWYNFTCMCSSAEVKAFKAGRAWQAKSQADSLGLMHDSVHKSVGNGRTAKTVRNLDKLEAYHTIEAEEQLINHMAAKISEPPRVTEDMTPEEANAMRWWSAQVCMTTWAGDWSQDNRLAWLYGIVVGWDDESLAELTEDFGWDPDTVERLISLMPKDRND